MNGYWEVGSWYVDANAAVSVNVAYNLLVGSILYVLYTLDIFFKSVKVVQDNKEVIQLGILTKLRGIQ